MLETLGAVLLVQTPEMNLYETQLIAIQKKIFVRYLSLCTSKQYLHTFWQNKTVLLYTKGACQIVNTSAKLMKHCLSIKSIAM